MIPTPTMLSLPSDTKVRLRLEISIDSKLDSTKALLSIRKGKYVSPFHTRLTSMALNDVKSPEQPGQIISDRNTS